MANAMYVYLGTMEMSILKRKVGNLKEHMLHLVMVNPWLVRRFNSERTIHLLAFSHEAMPGHVFSLRASILTMHQVSLASDYALAT
jgi:hypothetical protein